jgi:hypothetical protein
MVFDLVIDSNALTDTEIEKPESPEPVKSTPAHFFASLWALTICR